MFKKLAGLFAALAISMFWVGTATAEITGSAHDFQNSGTAWVTTDQICVVCHAPHNNEQASGLLWNRVLTTATYVPYSNTDTMSSAPGQPGASSKLCLGCHDGTIAVDSYGGVTGSNKITSGAAFVGIDLQNDHPIGFTYPTSVQDPEINESSSLVGGSGPLAAQTIAAAMLSVGTTMACESCHDVHNTNSATFPKLLLEDTTGSALCLVCHAK
jgi:predicted CXXCH cytochrome family protein